MSGKYFISLCLLLGLSACFTANPKATSAFVFQPRLSDYGFFKGVLSDLEPENERVIPYELNSTLFTDYALKKRFIVLPEGSVLAYQGEGLPVFPEGSILIKNFYYALDERQEDSPLQMVETRLLVRDDNRWKVATYVWNADQTDAEHEILGAEKDISWINQAGISQQLRYTIPDNNDCKSCHKNQGEVMPIGPKIRNLNGESPIGDMFGNQLRQWTEKGWLSDLPENFSTVSKLPSWADTSENLNARARAYLEINCAHCHSAAGPANNTALNLNFNETDDHKLGICKGPVSAAQGSGHLRYDIVPGNAEQSIIHYRMNSLETSVAMPEIGKNLLHEEGIALIAQWINQMEPGVCR